MSKCTLLRIKRVEELMRRGKMIMRSKDSREERERENMQIGATPPLKKQLQGLQRSILSEVESKTELLIPKNINLRCTNIFSPIRQLIAKLGFSV